MNRSRLTGLVLLLTLSGCRLYGGHGTTDAIRNDLGIALEEFESVYTSAQADLARIQGAGASPDIARFASMFESAVSLQAEQLEISSARAHDAMEHGGYRKVSRALGMLVAEKTVASERYRSILLAQARAAGLSPANVTLVDSAPTQAVPAYYQRAAGDNVPSVQTILASLGN